MTDFLQWWADHWPLAVVLAPLLILYPYYALWAWGVFDRLRARRDVKGDCDCAACTIAEGRREP